MRYFRYWIIWTLDFSQKFYSGDHLFAYDSYDNSVLVLIQTTPESEDIPEVEMTYKEVVDNMGDDMLD